MNQPLCSSAGNALEVLRTVEVLIGSNTEPRLSEVVCALGGEILSSTGLSTSTVDGVRRIKNSLETGHAAEMFEKMIFEYKSGKEKALNALVGQVMKASKGRANAQSVKNKIIDAIGKI